MCIYKKYFYYFRKKLYYNEIININYQNCF